MTDAPKTIWRVAAYIPRHNDHGLASWPVKDHAGDGAVEYTLTTHSDALVAAAYEDGLSDGNAIAHGNEPACDPPAKAQAAYDAAIAQARREGWEAGRSEAAGLADALAVEMEAYMAIPTTTTKSKALCIRNRIQALEYKEPE